MPKLSIITVNYNNKAGLIDTAQSVVAQTWTDYEWIIIDGGSTDGSVEVIKEYAGKTDKLVYWCSEPDGGIYQGMNKGIEKAIGEYCWFLNSGDYAYQNTTLEDIFAVKFDEDIIYGNIKMAFTADTEMKYIYSRINTKKKNPYQPINWIYYTVIRHQASFISRQLFASLGLYNVDDYVISADYEFFVRSIFKYSARVRHINTIFSLYNLNGISFRRESQKIIHDEYRKVIMEIFPDSYKNIFLKSHIRKIIFYILIWPWLQPKYIIARIIKFGFSRTVAYYKSVVVGLFRRK